MITTDSTFDAANAILAKHPYIALEIDGYSRKFTNVDVGLDQYFPWIAEDGISNIEFNTSVLDGTSELGDVTVTVLDYQGLLTADMPSITLEGRQVRIKVWFPGVELAHAMILFTGKIDLVQCSNTNTTYDFVLKDSRIDLKQVVYLTGDDGQPTDSDHHKTVIGHPLDILKDILISQLEISTSVIDVALIDAYRDGPFGGSIFEFVITSPPEAKDFIESQIMKPLGGCLRMTASGIFTPFFLISLAGAVSSVQSFDENSLIDIPQVQQADLVNVVSYRFDKDDTGFKSEDINTNADSVTKYGQGHRIIESDGMRSGFQGFFLANIVSREIFNRYGSKNPMFDADVLWTGCKVEVGDVVSITHHLMPDRKAGVMGVTNSWFQVASVKFNLSDFVVTLSLVDVGALRTYGAFRIAPDSQSSWSNMATTSDEKLRYMFITGSDGLYSDDVAGNPLG